ncbi:MAG: hypothetical protein VW778_01865, partial [Betaproteobacteria bacterium]
MDRSFRNLITLIAGLVLVVLSFVFDAILVDADTLQWTLLIGGLLITASGAYLLREELTIFFSRQRGEALIRSVGLIGIVAAVCYLSVRFPARIDMTESNMYSLSPDTVEMLERLENPVHIAFFHDP